MAIQKKDEDPDGFDLESVRARLYERQDFSLLGAHVDRFLTVENRPVVRATRNRIPAPFPVESTIVPQVELDLLMAELFDQPVEQPEDDDIDFFPEPLANNQAAPKIEFPARLQPLLFAPYARAHYALLDQLPLRGVRVGSKLWRTKVGRTCAIVSSSPLFSARWLIFSPDAASRRLWGCWDRMWPHLQQGTA